MCASSRTWARVAMTRRLRSRFADLPGSVVERCVDDLWACCLHLGLVPDLEIIERLAGERLTGVVKGRPPSQRVSVQRKVIPAAGGTRVAARSARAPS